MIPRIGNAAHRRSFDQALTVFNYPNYRLWFFGQLFSLFGTWMQITAQGYFVYQLTKSAAYLGYIGFAYGAPALLFTLYGGVVADRVPRRRLLLITQTTMMTLAGILAVLTFTGRVQAWHMVVLALGLGMANAFDAPARQAFILEIVDREDVMSAIALNSTMSNMATAIGPAAAGLAYAVLGPAWCFTFNALSFLAVIAALLKMSLQSPEMPTRVTSALEDLKQGLEYVVTQPTIRAIILMIGLSSLFGYSITALTPAWAVKILGGNATTNGLLFTARGIGALASAFMVAWLGRFKLKGQLLTVGSLLFPVLSLIFAEVRWLPLSLLVLVGVGWAVMLFFNLAMALVQMQAPDELCGRVMGVFSLTAFSLTPVGALLSGTVAEHIGEPNTVMLGAVIGLVVAVLVTWGEPSVRALP